MNRKNGSEGKLFAFGIWDAPMTDGAVWIEVPTELECMYCRQHFVEGDNGAVMPVGFAQHRECGLRSVMGGIGHVLDHERYCNDIGPDAGLGFRQSALLVWRHLVEKRFVTDYELVMLRSSRGDYH